MKEYTLEEFLEGYGEQVPQPLKGAQLLKISYDESGGGSIRLTTHCRELVSFADVCAFEHEMCDKLGLYSFSLALKYTPDMLSADYFYDLTQFLKSRFPTVNGFFDGADVSFDGSVFHVGLKNGGAEVLKKAGIDVAFPQLVHDMFSISTGIELGGVTSIDPEVYESEQKKLLDAIPINVPLPSEGAPAKN
ncbi:MAG: PolC-type DNA polymerase III, partial [Ruminococcus sp.]|nr:PolC-type DNA polymerase III [Ruminococcus sp.]